VNCEGRISNRSAIGAKIRVLATIGGKTFWQMREIAANGGYMSATTLEAHFGLGDATAISAMQIEWPSGILQEIGPLNADQFISVEEPLRLQIQPTAGTTLNISTEGRGDAVIERTSNFLDWQTVGSRNDTNRTSQVDMSGETAFFRLR